MRELETATTDELIAELSRRADSAVFALQLDRTPTHKPVIVSYFGTVATCVGLTTYARAYLFREIRESFNGD